MTWKLPTLFCACVTLACFFSEGASAQAGHGRRNCPGFYVTDGMNLPTAMDECDYRCAGYGCHGWYHREFGSNYNFAHYPASSRVNCSPLGFCYTRHCTGLMP